jgi:hypothetical protein
MLSLTSTVVPVNLSVFGYVSLSGGFYFILSAFTPHPLYPPLQTEDWKMPQIILFGEGERF